MEKATLIGSTNITRVYERLRNIDSVKDGKVDNVISREELDEARKEGVDTTIEFKEGKASSLDALQRLYIKLQELDAADGAKDGNIKGLSEHLGVTLTEEQKDQFSVSAEIEFFDKSVSSSIIPPAYVSSAQIEDSAAYKAVEQIEKTLTEASKQNYLVKEYKYKRVVARLINVYKNIDAINLYRLFLYSGSPERAQAITALKEKGIYEQVEKDRARLTMEELLGKSFADEINLILMRLIDTTRFKDFGWLWATTLNDMKSDNYFRKEADKILSPIMKECLPFLQSTDLETFSIIFSYIGEDCCAEDPNVTSAGWEAARTFSDLLRLRLMKDLQIQNIINTNSQILSDKNTEKSYEHLLLLRFLSQYKPDTIPDEFTSLLMGHLKRDSFKRFRYLSHTCSYRSSYDLAAPVLSLFGLRVFSCLGDALRNNDSILKAGICEFLSYKLNGGPTLVANIRDEVIPLLINNLNNNSCYNLHFGWEFSYSCLAIIGKRTLPYLKEALNHEDTEIAERAAELIKTIGGEK